MGGFFYVIYQKKCFHKKKRDLEKNIMCVPQPTFIFCLNYFTTYGLALVLLVFFTKPAKPLFLHLF